MIVSLIAAMSENRVIGREGLLPWYLPEDLRRFRALTEGHPVIMGRKTYESIGRLLPKRQNIIVTRQENYHVPGAQVVRTLGEAWAGLQGEVFIIGGGEIYRLALPDAQKIYLTVIRQEIDGDTFFPEFDFTQFRETSREDFAGSPSYSFLVFERIKAS